MRNNKPYKVITNTITRRKSDELLQVNQEGYEIKTRK